MVRVGRCEAQLGMKTTTGGEITKVEADRCRVKSSDGRERWCDTVCVPLSEFLRFTKGAVGQAAEESEVKHDPPAEAAPPAAAKHDHKMRRLPDYAPDPAAIGPHPFSREPNHPLGLCEECRRYEDDPLHAGAVIELEEAVPEVEEVRAVAAGAAATPAARSGRKAKQPAPRAEGGALARHAQAADGPLEAKTDEPPAGTVFEQDGSLWLAARVPGRQWPQRYRLVPEDEIFFEPDGPAGWPYHGRRYEHEGAVYVMLAPR